MNDNNKIFNDDLELENLLKPKAQFRVSPAFKQRVMAEAKAMPTKRRRWIPYAASTAAAAVATLVILTAVHFHNSESPAVQPPTTASTEITNSSSGDSLNNEAHTPLLAEAPSILKKEKTTSQKRTNRKSPEKRTASSMADTGNSSEQESQLESVTEGEMPMISRETPQEPDEVRLRLIETRRNAEIAYIERMRDEIEANQAYIAQLMAETNVNQ